MSQITPPPSMPSKPNFNSKPSINVPLPKPTPKPDSSIFGGKQELARSEFRQKLMGTEGWKASERAGLNISATERAKLEKQIFSSSYGSSISKSDLKRGEAQLNQKIYSAKTPEERNTIRKQINFLKKLGGS